MNTTQINFRIPENLKADATKKAKEMGINLNSLVKLFLFKLVKEKDFIVIKKDINFEKMFNRGIEKAFLSDKAKKKTSLIAKKLADC